MPRLYLFYSIRDKSHLPPFSGCEKWMAKRIRKGITREFQIYKSVPFWGEMVFDLDSLL